MLEDLVRMSNEYGSNPEYVLAGGGNTSWKDDKVLYVKGSGTSLATITSSEFVAMDREKLNDILKKDYPKDDDAREAAALEDLLAAKLPGNEAKRPSVETTLHNLFAYAYVLHVHPTLVNGLTCGADGEEIANKLFDGEFIWIPIFRPGYVLADLCNRKMAAYKKQTGRDVQMILLQNHGVFIAADTREEIDRLFGNMMDKLQGQLKRKPDFTPVSADAKKVAEAEEKIHALYAGQEWLTEFLLNRDIEGYIKNRETFAPLSNAFTPDHIVYCKAEFLFVEKIETIQNDFDAFLERNGYQPKIIVIAGLGVFAVANSKNDLTRAVMLFLDAVKVAGYSESFGGYLHMTPDLIYFIVHWEMEAYRQKVNA